MGGDGWTSPSLFGGASVALEVSVYHKDGQGTAPSGELEVVVKYDRERALREAARGNG